jgi:hypothetical protein
MEQLHNPRHGGQAQSCKHKIYLHVLLTLFKTKGNRKWKKKVFASLANGTVADNFCYYVV